MGVALKGHFYFGEGVKHQHTTNETGRQAQAAQALNPKRI